MTAVSGVSLALGGGLLRELVRQGRLHRFRVTRPQLGTLVSITAVHPDRRDGEAVVHGAFAEIERLEGILSRHRPGSALSRLNRSGAIDRAPAELLYVLTEALEYGRVTGGAFDLTVAPVLDLYRESTTQGQGLPREKEVAAALQWVDFRRVSLRGTGVSLYGAGTRVTLDGVAKGYIVDRAVHVMMGGGAEQVLVDAGGDMASGVASGTGVPWEIRVAHPRRPGEHVGGTQLAGNAAATSGDYMQRFSADFRNHHIIDPRTGRSPELMSSVTVVAGSALEADALSTAVFVLGPDSGRQLLNQLAGVEGLLVTRAGAVSETPGFSH